MQSAAPEIAIVDPNTLSCLGLENLLSELIPTATIRTFNSFAALVDDTPDMYAHYFVAMGIYFEHTAFFLKRRFQTVVLCNGDNLPQLGGVLTLNIGQDEQHLAKSILMLHRHGHSAHQEGGMHMPVRMPADDSLLTAREVEVLVMVVKGLLNKEIADRLSIGLTTVITHRKNITDKLGIKSVSGLTIYAVMHGYVEADTI